MTKQGVTYCSIAKLFCLCLLISHQATFSREIVVDFKGKSPSPQQQAVIFEWLNYGVDAVEKTLGPMAQSTVPISVSMTSAKEPVPWGQVVRGHIDEINMRIGEFNSIDDLTSDWTLYHEFSHLYHPLFAYQDFWLAEGLATYFQNVVMLQNGIYSKAEFLRRIQDGLERGKVATRSHMGQLDKVSVNMWRLRAYQRVYWTGAAFFVEAETLLKKAGAKYTVAQILAMYQVCCRSGESEGASKSAYKFVARLDSLSGTKVFLPLYKRYRYAKGFPNINNEQLALLIKIYSPREPEL
ncbi:hypothetical protein N480_11745 [Pseudoalteromonas luteoviolacea S2607]|uniref:M61 family metallopeptidase n=1 Tax=Pseudoalteromonas luteoviolacea TaxID=43657 RepID=UPI0007B0787D|nr:hypothetical protein [Pseudoalteromonas luteoviolacea]KZN38896.1 hypothetical protein N480_11745 [Pseudoalteromonas luteoviolacea S2607]